MSDDLTYDQKPEFKALDDAIREWNRAEDDEADEFIITGWLLAVSTMRVGNIPDGQVGGHCLSYVGAPGQSYHHSLGLSSDLYDRVLHPVMAVDDEDDE